MTQSMNLRLFFFIFTLTVIPITRSSSSDDYQPYIVLMDKSMMPSPFSNHHNWYTSLLSSLTDEEPAKHLYTYNHVMDGFSAVLTKSQLERLEKMSGHLATFEDQLGQLHTTHTPKFLGLKKHAGLWPISGFGEDMIIGILDTGIWPESESFHDKGMSEIPSRWRGACEAENFCNKKLIGARSFSQGMKHLKENISTTDDYDSPRDFEGHGTHTSSTAAGNRVQSADYFGYAKGTATGIAPKARLAMYKVLFLDNSYDAAASDTLAGMDQAIEDGVDLMSLSLGFDETRFYQNPIAIGAFAAMEKGIFVSCSAGNAGPHPYTMLNGAPWITTVGAGTIDRDFVAYVTPGDQKYGILIGKSIFPQNLLVERVPIYYGYGNKSKEACDDGSLDPKDVQGKYIFCDGMSQTELETSGAAGAIFISESDDSKFLQPIDFNLPYVVLEPKVGHRLKNYIINTKNASISVKYGETLLDVKPAPQVADFSSRGPATRSPWILKPDLLAPGVNILAAWAPNRASAPIGDDYLLSDYKLVSGTSMASPHVVGIASLLKSTHRDWSPAAIRSAMMTTADILDNNRSIIMDMTFGEPGTPLDYGAGHVNPNKAMDPGLIYDIKPQDYINYLCAINYTRHQIQIISKQSEIDCSNATLDLNYPSFMLVLNNTNTTRSTFQRVLTNVGTSSSSYRAVVDTPPTGMNIVVKPSVISFEGKYSTAKFEVIVDVDITDAPPAVYGYFGNCGYLSWFEVNGTHVVRSPIVSAIASARPP
ncbi:putative tripeptidyl-peptidase II [Helianthus annuus]|uniref:Putative peptidase S8, subtilisin-related protein n=1 Tax=Helianthus annuus TaxID=4232 RepID=A0A251V746_HELAN|nr:subtilisin-like protease SBT3 [Helianthus annuus]KAF5814047.1 putative tripeptidyl-peptidase II [Helianthus annuus]KAJ0592722.1 putative tripeptidyl-peptidase II [Helianthus annuus]KAJ0600364.1 putative tripeptidyl-peptidase II [Helianthus annuus]KAJ0607721.1 putative tripeptidyl-peptidase II [Helianthus annuus]KAJ0767786.1 putative tripeptidyl-peptidase II [Helianthus annuus]